MFRSVIRKQTEFTINKILSYRKRAILWAIASILFGEAYHFAKGKKRKHPIYDPRRLLWDMVTVGLGWGVDLIYAVKYGGDVLTQALGTGFGPVGSDVNQFARGMFYGNLDDIANVAGPYVIRAALPAKYAKTYGTVLATWKTIDDFYERYFEGEKEVAPGIMKAR